MIALIHFYRVSQLKTGLLETILFAKQEIELSCIWASLSLILTKYMVPKIILPLKNLSGNKKYDMETGIFGL